MKSTHKRFRAGQVLRQNPMNKEMHRKAGVVLNGVLKLSNDRNGFNLSFISAAIDVGKGGGATTTQFAMFRFPPGELFNLFLSLSTF